MTENEAKELLESIVFEDFAPNTQKAVLVAIKVLEEIQAYRAIGAVKELQSMKEHGAFTGTELAQIAVCQMELQKYMAIGTIEEFKALKEKNEPKKVKGISLTHEGHVGNCPTCGKFIRYREQTTHCVCEQKLAWSEEGGAV